MFFASWSAKAICVTSSSRSSTRNTPLADSPRFMLNAEKVTSSPSALNGPVSGSFNQPAPRRPSPSCPRTKWMASLWSWQTRDSVTPSTSPISRSVQLS